MKYVVPPTYLFLFSFLRWPSRLGLQNLPTASLQRSKGFPNKTQSARAAEYTDFISANEYPRHDTELSHGETFIMLELWEIRSTSLLTSLPGPF